MSILVKPPKQIFDFVIDLAFFVSACSALRDWIIYIMMLCVAVTYASLQIYKGKNKNTGLEEHFFPS